MQLDQAIFAIIAIPLFEAIMLLSYYYIIKKN
jgi:hypothetical protein